MAAHRAAEALRATDEKRMAAALAEIAAEEMARNPSFALRVRSRYEALEPPKKTRAAKALKDPQKPKLPPAPRAATEPLVAIKPSVDYQIDVARPLDPYEILEYFGAHQLPLAFDSQHLTTLRDSATFVEDRHPGTKPKGRATREKLFAYIMQYVLNVSPEDAERLAQTYLRPPA
ncbi:MAG TPA: hypothetical protein VMV29_18510 [Ktedonobacterales bacterium]|nr:hypothetical protein [Ktedonobacterales bacterium]